MHDRSVIDAAWSYYTEALEETREHVLNHELSRDPRRLGQGLCLLSQMQAVGYTMYIAPRLDHPFFSADYGQNLMFSWGGPNPDFRYRWTFIDGRNNYRIWGMRNDPVLVDLQFAQGWWGSPDYKASLGSYGLDKFQLGPDGSFEIILSAEPQPGNWIRIDRDIRRITIVLRQSIIDWLNDNPAEIHIERIGEDRSGSVDVSPEEHAHRLRLAAGFVREAFACARRVYDPLTVPERLNKHTDFSTLIRGEGGHPTAGYAKTVFSIKDDEALFIEVKLPSAKYWGLLCYDLWMQTTDFKHHQSNLNAKTARIDTDGKLRVAVCNRDPGIQNWIDPAGDTLATLTWRWYESDSFPVPESKVVRIDDLRKCLPADTPVFTPEQRRKMMEERRRGVEKLYGQ